MLEGIVGKRKVKLKHIVITLIYEKRPIILEKVNFSSERQLWRFREEVQTTIAREKALIVLQWS